MAELPEFVEPMLARQGEPFDSDEHLFEVKWDGTRAQARLPGAGGGGGGGGYLLTNRRRRDLTVRYPEFGFLGEIGAGGGALLDGEIVVMRDGKPDFRSMLRREQAHQDLRIRNLANTLPATLVVFDLLFVEGRSVMGETLDDRRALLREFVEAVSDPRMILSEGVVGAGRDFFAAVTAQSLEGVMAKRLSSRYEPGRRTDDWLKIKQKHTLHCAIVGFVAEKRDIRALIIAAQLGNDPEAPLQCVGRVGSGLSEAMRTQLAELLFARLRDTPFLPCEEAGQFVEPGLYCKVSYLEQTRAGHLRAPVFLDLIVDE